MIRITRWEDLRPGCVGCVMGTGFFSRAIQFFDRGKFSHAFHVQRMDGAKPILQEALDGGIQETDAINYRKGFEAEKPTVCFWLPDVPEPALIVGLSKAAGRLGSPYPFLSTGSLALTLALDRVFGLIGRQAPTIFRRGWKCSENVFVLMRDAKLAANRMYLDAPDLNPILAFKDQESFTPNRQAEWCESLCKGDQA